MRACTHALVHMYAAYHAHERKQHVPVAPVTLVLRQVAFKQAALYVVLCSATTITPLASAYPTCPRSVCTVTSSQHA